MTVGNIKFVNFTILIVNSYFKIVLGKSVLQTLWSIYFFFASVKWNVLHINSQWPKTFKYCSTRSAFYFCICSHIVISIYKVWTKIQMRMSAGIFVRVSLHDTYPPEVFLITQHLAGLNYHNHHLLLHVLLLQMLSFSNRRRWRHNTLPFPYFREFEWVWISL